MSEQVDGRKYRENGSRVWECSNCDCARCAYFENNSYDAKVCRFKQRNCAVCKGRHSKVMCPDFKQEYVRRLQ